MPKSAPNALPPACLRRWRALLPAVQQLPPAGARPLTVTGRVAGWIIPRALAPLHDMPGVRIEDEAAHVFAAPGFSLNDTLAALALRLREAGCLRSWRDECLDVYAEGRALAALERGAVRPLGLLTQAVHLNAWSADGRLWVARRALSKSSDPGLWDTLVGGLVSAGETLDGALLRESHEEAGLQPAQLAGREPIRMITRMHRQLPEGYQVENVLVSDCVLPDDARPHNLDGEVSEIRLIDLDALVAMLEAGELTLEAELVILDSLRRRAGLEPSS